MMPGDPVSVVLVVSNDVGFITTPMVFALSYYILY